MNALHPARWAEPADARGKIRCGLCPRGCQLGLDQAGFCFIRQNRDGQLITLGYGRTTGFAVDPIEKKPLNHFYPATGILSFGTVGCNLACKFCQNWTSSRSKAAGRRGELVTPADVVKLAELESCPSIAFTYNEPIIFAEFAIDVARLAHERGIKTVAVTAGYISPTARGEFFAHMDAANVDLKSMSESFYRKMSGVHLAPVLETLDYLARETKVWVEVTNLVIPGANDSEAELDQLSGWVVEHLGADTPIHFSAFHPDYKLDGIERTPSTTLARARELAQKNGARYVYTGNVYDTRGQSTYCPSCGELVIGRQGFRVAPYKLDDKGHCSSCGGAIAGRFGAAAGQIS